MSVLELHPELETFVGNNYGKTGGIKVLYYGESHFLPNNKGETFSDEDIGIIILLKSLV